MLKLFFLIFLGVICAHGSVSLHNPFYCFDTDPIKPQNTMFAPVTSYDNARGRGFINPSVSMGAPRKLFLLSRHGTTLPIASEINRMLDIHESLKRRVIENYDAGRSQLCREDIQNIREWYISPDLQPERSFELTPQGWNEFRGLGERLSEAFPDVLPRKYSPAQFLFRGYGNTSVNGLQGFAEGVFGEWDIVEFAAGSEPDILLMPTSHCPLYDEARTNSIEMDAFESGPEFNEMALQVNRKLGFIGSNQLGAWDIRVVWDFCRFEQGWNSTTPSPWCAAFSISNHAILEYWLDLQYYYIAGYGGDVPLFSNINCQVLQDLLTFIESNDPDDHLARIYGTQALALPMFLVSLGAFNGDELLTRHNFAQQTFRQWRTSLMDNTGSNFVLVKFECTDGDDDLLLLLNERPLSIPGCNAVTGLCKQSVFVERYRRFLNANCSEVFCSRTSS